MQKLSLILCEGKGGVSVYCASVPLLLSRESKRTKKKNGVVFVTKVTMGGIEYKAVSEQCRTTTCKVDTNKNVWEGTK